MTLLQQYELLKREDSTLFEEITKETNEMRSKVTGQLIKNDVIESIRKEIELIRAERNSKNTNEPVVDLKIEYLEFNEEQKRKDSANVSALKYNGPKQKFSHLATRRRELRIVVLGVRNIPDDCEIDDVRVKLKIIRGGQDEIQKGKSELLHLDGQQSLRFVHFFVIQDSPGDKFANDYLNLYLDTTSKTGLIRNPTKSTKFHPVSLLAPICDSNTGKEFRLQDILGRSGMEQKISIRLQRLSLFESASNPHADRSWRKKSIKKERRV